MRPVVAVQPIGNALWLKSSRLITPDFRLRAGTIRQGVPVRPAKTLLSTMSLSGVLPWAAAHGPAVFGSAGVMAPTMDSVLQVLDCITGSWTGAAALWTLVSMLLYAARRSHLHGLSVSTILARHFINGFDEPPHPYFVVSQKVPLGMFLCKVRYVFTLDDGCRSPSAVG